MPQFVLGRDVAENVRNLRVALGSITRPLGVIDFARVLSDRHPERSISMSTVQRWEAGTQPDLHSIAVMAELAGVSFEAFAFGSTGPGRIAKTAPTAAFTKAGEEVKRPKKKRA